MDSTIDARERLAREDGNFQRLERKHSEYEQQLAQFRERRYLSDADRIEEVRLKKLKLAVKDQMEALIRQAIGA